MRKLLLCLMICLSTGSYAYTRTSTITKEAEKIEKAEEQRKDRLSRRKRIQSNRFNLQSRFFKTAINIICGCGLSRYDLIITLQLRSTHPYWIHDIRLIIDGIFLW